MEQTYKELFDRFYQIQCEKYLESAGKETFETGVEKETILKTVREGWDQYIESKKEKLLAMSEREIGNLFEAIDLEFPRYTDKKNENLFFDGDDIESLDEFYGGDDDDEDYDEDIEALNEELNRLSDELDAIPEDEREDVVMLMLAFPALQEIGFPVDVFMGGDGSTHLTDKQREQIDWARQLAYKIVEMSDETDPEEKSAKYKEITTFAAAFVPSPKIEKVVTEIQTAYESGKNFG